MKRNLSGWGVTMAGLLLAGGGGYAMWAGWDMILLERGWSLFIAGAVALSGGVVTMALGRVIAHLARLAAPLSELRAQPAVAAPAEPAPTVAPAIVEPPRKAPGGEGEEKASAAPSPVKAPPPPAQPPVTPPANASVAKAASPQSAIPKPDDKPVRSEGAPPRRAAVPPRFAALRPKPPQSEKPPQNEEPTAETKTESPPDFAALLNPQAQPQAETQTEPSEVDRYSAGDATYVMMSDGSVEVHTAAGVQRYESLAALKAETSSRQR